MQKLTRSFLLAGAALGLAACGDDVSVTPPAETPPAVVTGVTVSPSSISIAKGQTVVATAQVAVSTGSGTVDKTVAWTSADANIATVGATTGAITGVNPGTTTIRATAGGVTGAATVTVTLGVSAVAVTPQTIALKVGEKATPTATVTRENGVAGTVTWSVPAGTQAVTVNATTGEITAVAVGTAVVTAASTVDPSKTASIAVTVAAQDLALNTFSVTPTTVSLGLGGEQVVSAVAQAASGATVTYTNNAADAASGCPGIATASTDANSGATTITAVASGSCVVTVTATGSGTGLATNSLKATIAVQVVTPQVSINSITTGMTNTPVQVNNVNGQIEVNLNFQPSGVAIDSVVVYMNQPDGLRRVARQGFGGAIPAAGILSLSVNTANFVKNRAEPSVTVDLLNGPSTVSAQVFPKGTTGSSAANCTNNPSDPTCAAPVQIVLNNMDGWTADITKPAVSAISAGNVTYWGGPTANADVTVYPVIYTPGRSVSNAVWTLGGCPVTATGPLAASNGGRTQQGHSQSFGYASNGADVNCTSYENTGGIRDNVYVTAAQDNTNDAYALSPLIANTVVFNATPDSLRIDYKAPTVSTPSITRTLPAVTGWVNGPFSFINFASTDLGVGLRATRDRSTTYSSVNCSGVTATDMAMATGTGADINGGVACPTNFIGGTPGLGGTAPWTVKGHESDRLANTGTSSATQTFGTDYTNPDIRWGLADAGLAYPAAYGGTATDPVDSVFAAAKPVAGTNEFRAEYLDDRAGFYNAGQPDGAGIAAQSHFLTTAGHLNPMGICLVGTNPPGATFVTNPGCGFAYIGTGASLRTDGWQSGQRVDIPQPEGYYGYKTWVIDAAGNQSATLFRSTLVNSESPFATGLGIPATLNATTFDFNATHADSAEIIARSLQLTYPELPTIDSLRYRRDSIRTPFDDIISSPLAAAYAPAHGAPYVRSLESVNANAFPAANIINAAAYAGVSPKPTFVDVWSWNFGSMQAGGPASTRSAQINIPALNVENGSGVGAWNTANPTIAVNHWRLITTVATSNQFGSTTPLRAQAVSPTNAPNPPFARVDFYRLMTDADAIYTGAGTPAYWNYLGSSSTALGTDQGTYRSWIYALPNASFVNAWNGSVAQSAIASTQVIIAVGVLANGDAVVTAATTMTP